MIFPLSAMPSRFHRHVVCCPVLSACCGTWFCWRVQTRVLGQTTVIYSSSAPKASQWLSTIPSRTSLTLSNWDFRCASRALLGLAPAPAESMLDQCRCGADYQLDPYHFMSCKSVSSGTRNRRHRWVCEAVARWARSLGAMVRLEPPRLDRVDNKPLTSTTYSTSPSCIRLLFPTRRPLRPSTSPLRYKLSAASPPSTVTSPPPPTLSFPLLLLSLLVVSVRKLLSLFSPLCVRPRVPIWRGARMRLCMVFRAKLPLLSNVGMH